MERLPDDGPDREVLAANLRQQQAFYLPRLAEHGVSHLAVGWLREVDQTVRFDNLTLVAGLEQHAVLDVGCGLGHLYPFLRERGHVGSYLGVDVLPEMVERARALHPGGRFEVADITDPAARFAADSVIASGAITLSEPAVAHRMIAAMFRAARVCVAFNALSAWNPVPPRAPFRHFDPLAIMAFCKTLTPYILLRHDYSVQDFTVYLFRGLHT